MREAQRISSPRPGSRPSSSLPWGAITYMSTMGSLSAAARHAGRSDQSGRATWRRAVARGMRGERVLRELLPGSAAAGAPGSVLLRAERCLLRRPGAGCGRARSRPSPARGALSRRWCDPARASACSCRTRRSGWSDRAARADPRHRGSPLRGLPLALPGPGGGVEEGLIWRPSRSRGMGAQGQQGAGLQEGRSESSVVPDKDYNLVSVLYHTLKGAETHSPVHPGCEEAG